MTILASARLQKVSRRSEARPSRPEAENGGRTSNHNVCRGDTCIPYLQRECGRDWKIGMYSAAAPLYQYALLGPAPLQPGPHVGLSLPVSAVWHDSCKATDESCHQSAVHVNTINAGTPPRTSQGSFRHKNGRQMGGSKLKYHPMIASVITIATGLLITSVNQKSRS